MYPMKYRREIDGLRALAILPVILFHAGLQTFSGGFVGVDIFFVISGYLITTIIVTEKEAKTFTILNFYERRARRILPALFFVMFTCLPFAWFWLIPEDLKKFSDSLIAVTGFSSNILFWQSSGYFETSSELKPLLHTWSLAVEEQYYLFFPVFLILTWRLGKRLILFLLIFLAIISLAAAQWGSINKPDATFYLLPTRGWELLIGAFIAFYFSSSTKINFGKSTCQIASAIGFLLILCAIFYFNKQTPFPSLYTLVPTIGAALIIMFATQQTLVGKLLGNKLFVGLGLISYSAYLWHQPLFAFARYRSSEAPSKSVLIELAIVAIVLAYFSWKYIETPFRSKQRFDCKKIFLYSGSFSLLFFTIGLTGYFTKGFEKLKTTDDQRTVLQTVMSSPRRTECHSRGSEYPSPKEACEYETGKLSWATFGDSHTVELAYALAQKLKSSDTKLKHFSFSGCPPSYGRTIVGLNDCSNWTNASVKFIAENEDIKNVVISYRIHSALFGPHINTYPALPNDLNETEKLQIWGSYVEVLRYFVNHGKHVILVLQAPELPKPIVRLLLSEPNPLTQITGVNRSWWDERTKYVTERLNQIPQEVTVIDSTKLFCDDFNCFIARGGVAYYFDDNHISVASHLPIRSGRIASGWKFAPESGYILSNVA